MCLFNSQLLNLGIVLTSNSIKRVKQLFIRQEMILGFIKSCDEALVDEPNNLEVLKLRGLMYEIAGEYDKALKDFESAVKVIPDDAVSYYLKSSCHYSKGEYDLAKRDYMRAVQIQYPAKYTEEDINQAVILDEEDLGQIKTIIDSEKQQAIKRYYSALNPED